MSESPTNPASQPTPIRIFDTTLRDGEQSPGASLNHAEKLEIARQLEVLGVDVIEAGFPITSQGDFEAVRAIAAELEKTTVCGLSRCVPRDIDRAGEAVKDAANPNGGRIHVFCATSKIHREHKLRKAWDQIIRISVESVERARGFVDDVEFSPEDGSRTELDHLVEITHAVIEAGATTQRRGEPRRRAHPRLLRDQQDPPRAQAAQGVGPDHPDQRRERRARPRVCR